VFAVSSGYATNAGTAASATTAGTAGSATTAGTATFATSAGNAATAAFATSSEYATNAGSAVSAGTATFATSTATATNALNLGNIPPDGYVQTNDTRIARAITNLYSTGGGSVTVSGNIGTIDFGSGAGGVTNRWLLNGGTLFTNDEFEVITAGGLTGVLSNYSSRVQLTLTGSGTATFAESGNYATNAGYSVSSSYATNSGYAGSSGYATNAGSASFSVTGNYATNAGTATSAGTATFATSSGYATNAGTATFATTAGTAGFATSAGTATFAISANYATNAGAAVSAGTATFATSSGYATNAGTASTAGTATFAVSSGYATNAGTATFATSAGSAPAQSLSNVLVAGNVSGTGIVMTAKDSANSYGVFFVGSALTNQLFGSGSNLVHGAPSGATGEVWDAINLPYPASTNGNYQGMSVGTASFATTAGTAGSATSAGTATFANNANTATNALQLGGTAAAQYATTNLVNTTSNTLRLATLAITNNFGTTVPVNLTNAANQFVGSNASFGWITASNVVAGPLGGISFGSEHLYAWFTALLSNTTPLYIESSGDSTAVGFMNQSLNPLLSTYLSSFSYGDDAIGGSDVESWIAGGLTAQIANNPTLWIIRYGINDANNDGGATGGGVTNFQYYLRSALATIRASLPESRCSILLMMPNSVADTSGPYRNYQWCQAIEPVVRSAAREYGCAFFDTFAYLQDCSTNWMDSILIHPQAEEEMQIAQGIMSLIAPPAMMNVLATKLPVTANTNGAFWVAGNNVNDPTDWPSSTNSPYSYKSPFRNQRALTGNGFPIDGEVFTIAQPSGGDLQINYTYHPYITAPIAIRAGGQSDSWGSWYYPLLSSTTNGDYSGNSFSAPSLNASSDVVITANGSDTLAAGPLLFVRSVNGQQAFLNQLSSDGFEDMWVLQGGVGWQRVARVTTNSFILYGSGGFIGNASGLTNIPAAGISGTLPQYPTVQIATNAPFPGAVMYTSDGTNRTWIAASTVTNGLGYATPPGPIYWDGSIGTQTVQISQNNDYFYSNNVSVNQTINLSNAVAGCWASVEGRASASAAPTVTLSFGTATTNWLTGIWSSWSTGKYDSLDIKCLSTSPTTNLTLGFKEQP
jgi:hypothetical protein